jgi:hypothetical protein
LGLTGLVIISATVVLTGKRQEVPDEAPTQVALTLELADYYGNGHHGDGENTDPLSADEVEEHVNCMRREGFDVPDPTRTSDGWMISVEHPEDLNLESRQWREAMFVTCAPEPPPGPGDLIFGASILSSEEVGPFRACMQSAGFALPDPTFSAERNQWRFNTSEMGIDYGDENWNRAVFVECNPRDGS